MRTYAPKSIVWVISVVLGVLGIVGSLLFIPLVSAYKFALVVIAFLLLAVTTVLK